MPVTKGPLAVISNSHPMMNSRLNEIKDLPHSGTLKSPLFASYIKFIANWLGMGRRPGLDIPAAKRQ